MGIRPRAILAIFRRNFAAYFSSPAANVFITIFIVASAFLAFSGAAFFANNLADLSALNSVYHWLLVIFIPAITMSLWAEERKQGTDELLFTLPVRDIEIVLGKYFAALGVYTVALLFMLSHVAVLAWLGNPGLGLLAANYAGYWILGAALIALGMVASSLTNNNTVGFILGTAFCFAAVYAEDVTRLAFGAGSRLAAGAGLRAHFENFTYGVVALPDLIYFALFIVVMLYVNMVLIGRRHWSAGRDAESMGWHYGLRAACVVAAAVGLSVLAGRNLDTARADLTAEKLNSTSQITTDLLAGLPTDRAVYIQAFVSPEVPAQYVEIRRSLLRMLRQFEAQGAGRVIVTVYDTEGYSDNARQAEERYGILPTPVMEVSEGRFDQGRLYLHVVVSSGPEEEIINFADRGLSAEYELARSVRTVAKKGRRTIGILRTDAKMFGGFDMQAMRPQQPWRIVEELRKQYTVRGAEPDQPIDDEIDVLIAPLPSSLSPEQMDNLARYLTSGRPALLLVDPLPIQFPQLSPSQPKAPPQGNPYQQRQGPEEKGDIDGLLYSLGIEWMNDLIAWDSYNPLPKYSALEPEILFVTRQPADEESTLKPQFATDSAATESLQRLVMMFAGSLNRAAETTLTVKPLLRTGAQSGELRWRQVLSPGFFGMGMQMNPNRPHHRTGRQYILAMRVTGDLPDETQPPADDQKDKKKDDAPKAAVNAIVIADLDMISDTFFQMRQSGDREFSFDNINFVLNCADLLAGDDSLIALRNRRPTYRTLVRIEKQRETYEKQRQDKEKAAESEADTELADAQRRLTEKVKKLKERTDIDARTRATLVSNLEQTENKRFDAAKRAIEARKEERVYKAKQEMQKEVLTIERKTRMLAIALPFCPVLLEAVIVFLAMYLTERRQTPLSRSMRKRL